jgi:hypothetical protein
MIRCCGPRLAAKQLIGNAYRKIHHTAHSTRNLVYLSRLTFTLFYHKSGFVISALFYKPASQSEFDDKVTIKKAILNKAAHFKIV